MTRHILRRPRLASAYQRSLVWAEVSSIRHKIRTQLVSLFPFRRSLFISIQTLIHITALRGNFIHGFQAVRKTRLPHSIRLWTRPSLSNASSTRLWTSSGLSNSSSTRSRTGSSLSNPPICSSATNPQQVTPKTVNRHCDGNGSATCLDHPSRDHLYNDLALQKH